MTIGKNIAELRRAKNVKQEKLANSVGVSPQAVSKWEMGGSPDTELLPGIADFFGVSIDRLFGRKIAEYSDLGGEIYSHIASLDPDDSFAAAMEYCWVIEKALMGCRMREQNLALSMADVGLTLPKLAEINSGEYPNFPNSDKHTIYSQIIASNGFTQMAIPEKLQYFFLITEPEDGLTAGLCSIDEYQKLFAMLGQTDILKALFIVHAKHKNSETVLNSSYSVKHLEKIFELTPERVAPVIETMSEYGFLSENKIELDDEIQSVYSFGASPAFIAVLVLCQSLIQRPYAFMCQGDYRRTPFLR
jgi:transcriptional regulator with XRE-family HTH domain